MIDFLSPTVFAGAAMPILALHAYLVAPRKRKKKLWRASVVSSVVAIVAATLVIWSIERDRSAQNANGLAAGFFGMFSIVSILVLQILFLFFDLKVGTQKPRSYLEIQKESGR